MNARIILCLALVLGGGLFGFSQMVRAGETAARGQYDACWLSSQALGEYEKLVLTRKPLAELPGLALTTNQAVLDCDAIIVTTYARDSIWKNAEEKSFIPLTGVEMVGTNSIVIKGEKFACTNANLEDVLRLLRKPMGRIPIHRIYGVSAQVEPIRTLALRLERQINSGKP